MKKLAIAITTCVLTFGITVMPVLASSLDDVVNNEQTEQTNNNTATTQNDSTSTTQNQQPAVTNEVVPNEIAPNGVVSTDDYLESMKSATDLSEISPGASKLNEAVKKAASFIVQVLSFGVTVLLAARVALDLCYISLPFTRLLLANGHQANAQQGAQNGMGGMGMGGMGMGGMGMGGMGMGMGMGGMGGMQGQQQQQGMSMGIQWVSNAALNAVAAEQVTSPDGRAVKPIRVYIKDMAVILIVAPILLTLAVTGTLTNLGFLIGDMLANAVSSIGGMI